MINTRFWIDDYISNLDPIEKLLFLYLITNPATEICGVYEIPLKNVAMDTGIDKEMVIKILCRFERDNKVIYQKGWVAIVNFAKHQLKNPKVTEGIKRGLTNAPKEITDRLCIENDSLSHLDLDLDLDLTNTETSSVKGKKKFSLLGGEVIKSFEKIDPKNKTYYGNTTQRSSADFLVNEYGLELVQQVIGILPETNKIPFFPNITTANDLKEKWVKLADAVEREKNAKNSKLKERLNNVIW